MTSARRIHELSSPLPRSKKGDHMREVRFPDCEVIMVTAERAPGVKVELQSTSTGEVIERLLVDAKELVTTGEWAAVRLLP